MSREDLVQEAREQSSRELPRLVLLLTGRGIEVVVLGGWAVYAYNPYQQSMDIDIAVGRARDTDVGDLLNRLGWQPTDLALQDESFVRYAKSLSGREDQSIHLDVFRSNWPNRFRESPHIELPYTRALQPDMSVSKPIGGTEMRIPRRELLLLYKVKARRDRQYRLENENVEETERQRLRGKALKDASDILALLDARILGPSSVTALRDLIQRFNLEFTRNTFLELIQNNQARRSYRNISAQEAEAWISHALTAFAA